MCECDLTSCWLHLFYYTQFDFVIMSIRYSVIGNYKLVSA